MSATSAPMSRLCAIGSAAAGTAAASAVVCRAARCRGVGHDGASGHAHAGQPARRGQRAGVAPLDQALVADDGAARVAQQVVGRVAALQAERAGDAVDVGDAAGQRLQPRRRTRRDSGGDADARRRAPPWKDWP